MNVVTKVRTVPCRRIVMRNMVYSVIPVYAIYEKGTLSRVALINYLSDPSGNSDYTAVLSVGGNGQPNGTPAQVKVK